MSSNTTLRPRLFLIPRLCCPQVTSLMAPFTPFFAEFLYQKLRVLSPVFGSGDPEAFGSAHSVHFIQLPRNGAATPEAAAAATLVTQEMAALQTVRSVSGVCVCVCGIRSRRRTRRTPRRLHPHTPL